MEAKGVHPAAEVWPMLSGEELDALAADIAENGLRHPLVLDSDGLLLDGRNRLAACQMVDVAPTFEMFDGEPLAFIMSANAHRRHIKKGQQAMCVAMMYPELGGVGGRGKTDPAKTSQSVGGLKREYLRMARTVLAEDPDQAEMVRAGDLSLTKAYETVQAAISRKKFEREEMDRLKSHPDLVEWVLESVTDGERTVSEGLRLLAMDEFDRERVRSGGISIDEGELLTRDRNKAQLEQLDASVKGVRSYMRYNVMVKKYHAGDSWGEIMECLTDEECSFMRKEVDRWKK